MNNSSTFETSTQWVRSLSLPTECQSMVEEVWLLGPWESVSRVSNAIRDRITDEFKHDAVISQLWWKGQLVGVALEVGNDRSLLQDNFDFDAMIREGVDVHLMSSFCGVNEEDLLMLSFTGSTVRWVHPSTRSLRTLDVSSETPPLLRHCQLHEWLMEEGGLLDQQLATPVAAFEPLALQSDLGPFRQALATTEWTEENVRAWWRCSTNWVRREYCMSDEYQRLGRPKDNDVLHQAAVLHELGMALPQDMDGLIRAAEITNKMLGNTNATFRKDFEVASLQWLRTLAGEENAWNLTNSRICLMNRQSDGVLRWFHALPSSAQYQALDQAMETAQRVGQQVEKKGMPVAPHVATLHRYCPTWGGWRGFLEGVCESSRMPNSALDILLRMRAEEREERLEESLQEVASEPISRPRPRM